MPRRRPAVRSIDEMQPHTRQSPPPPLAWATNSRQAPEWISDQYPLHREDLDLRRSWQIGFNKRRKGGMEVLEVTMI